MLKLDEDIIRELESKKFKIIFLSARKVGRLKDEYIRVRILKEDWTKDKFYELKDFVGSRLRAYFIEQKLMKECETVNVRSIDDYSDYVSILCEIVSVKVIAEI
jgi:hypothetical protein